MKVSLKLLLGLYALSTVACAPKISSAPSVAVPTDTRDFDRRLTPRMREAFAEQNVPADLAKSGADLNRLTRGGPPGRVLLEGAFANLALPTLNISLNYGLGRDGQLPALPPAKPEFRPRATAETSADVASAAQRRDVIVVGCLMKPVATDGLTTGSFRAAPVTRIEAKVVELCALPTTAFYSLHVVAEKIVIKDVNFAFDGWSSRQLSLVAKEIVILGSNVVRTKAFDDELTFAAGPTVRLRADVISGDGTLGISGEGSNFVSKR